MVDPRIKAIFVINPYLTVQPPPVGARLPATECVALAKLMKRHKFMRVNTFEICETLQIYDC
ncbi:hypothetical protein ASF84_25255 [Pseudomonas sp. Leaf127]|nr:hypothetical protein ASF84_25255 [Pseudomonas sp. Leaf127]